LKDLSVACLRRLNSERDSDGKVKLIWAYKKLLKSSVNIHSHYNMERMIREGERSLRQLMQVENVRILVLER